MTCSTRKRPQIHFCNLTPHIFTRTQCSFINNTASLCRFEDYNKNLASTWCSKRYLLTWKTTSTRDWRQRSKQQFDSISEKKFADPFVKFIFLLTILDDCTSTKAFILSDFPHPFFGCLHFTVGHTVTPWNFSTSRVFWNLTVSIEDSLVYWIPQRFS